MKYEDKADYGDSQDILCVCSWGYGGVCMGMLSLLNGSIERKVHNGY